MKLLLLDDLLEFKYYQNMNWVIFYYPIKYITILIYYDIILVHLQLRET